MRAGELKVRREGKVPTASLESISRWIREAYPDWDRWRRPWRALLLLLVCYGSMDELLSEHGFDLDDLRKDSLHCGASFVLALCSYYETRMYPVVSHGGKRTPYELSPAEIAARLLYEEGLQACNRVALGRGVSDDFRLVDKLGFSLPLTVAVREREEYLDRERERGSRRAGNSNGGRLKSPFPRATLNGAD